MLGLVLHDVVGQEAKGVLGPDASTTDASNSNTQDAQIVVNTHNAQIGMFQQTMSHLCDRMMGNEATWHCNEFAGVGGGRHV